MGYFRFLRFYGDPVGKIWVFFCGYKFNLFSMTNADYEYWNWFFCDFTTFSAEVIFSPVLDCSCDLIICVSNLDKFKTLEVKETDNI